MTHPAHAPANAPANAPTNAMSVDVEDYFQVQAFAGTIGRERWDEFPRRVEDNTNRILDAFARAGVYATFFTLGWVAERHSGLVRRIVAEGHELASHGYGHELVDAMTPDAFRADISRARRVLEDIGGVAVQGYRAPTFSINTRNPWAFEVLAREGYRYSSSIYPIRHDIYGVPDAPRTPFRPNGLDLVEIPMTTVRVRDRNLPCAGGGYFRLLPYTLYRLGLRAVNHGGRRGIFYFHPWEIDAAQPRMVDAPRMSRFRHYVNLAEMPGRLERLLRDFTWDRMDRVFGDILLDTTRLQSSPI